MRIWVGTLDVTDDLIAGDQPGLTLEWMNEQGEWTIPSFSFSLTNQSGSYNALLSATQSSEVRIAFDEVTVFQGILSSDSISYDADNEIVSCEVIAIDKVILDFLKSFSIETWEPLRQNAWGLFTINSANQLARREFVNVQTAIRLICEFCSSLRVVYDETKIAIPTSWWFGGYYGLYANLTFPQWTMYEFLNSIAKACNAVWWFDDMRRLRMVPKAQYLASRRSYRIPHPELKNSAYLHTHEAVENVAVKFGGIIEGMQVHNPNPFGSRWKNISVPFSLPEFRTVAGYGILPVFTENANDVLMEYTNTGGVIDTHAVDVAQYHAIEVQSALELEATLSTMHETVNYAQLRDPFPYIGTQYDHEYHVRKLHIDPREETLQVTAVGYRP